MSFGKHGLKVILSVMAALGLMALSTSAAQASWLELVGGTPQLISGLRVFTGEIDLLNVLKVMGQNLEIDCTSLTVTKGELLGSGHSPPNVVHAEVLFEGCTANILSPLQAQAGCKLFPTLADKAAGTNEGKILVKALISVILDNGVGYALALGQEVAGPEYIFAQIFSLGCLGVPNGVLVKGEVVFNPHINGHAVRHLLTPEQTALHGGNKLIYGAGASAGLLLGSGWAQMTNGSSWDIC